MPRNHPLQIERHENQLGPLPSCHSFQTNLRRSSFQVDYLSCFSQILKFDALTLNVKQHISAEEKLLFRAS